MGYAIAEAAAKAGHEVTLISGPVSIAPPPNVKTIQVTTAAEMAAATKTALPPDPEHGFHVQAYIDHEDSSKSLAGANGEYDQRLRGWRVTLEAPRELKEGYRLQVGWNGRGTNDRSAIP